MILLLQEQCYNLLPSRLALHLTIQVYHKLTFMSIHKHSIWTYL
jgi:hypothetical protein